MRRLLKSIASGEEVTGDITTIRRQFINRRNKTSIQ